MGRGREEKERKKERKKKKDCHVEPQRGIDLLIGSVCVARSQDRTPHYACHFYADAVPFVIDVAANMLPI